MTRGSGESRHEADGHRRVAGSALRACWLSRSLDEGWPDPVGWRTPAVDGVVDALSAAEGSIARIEAALRALGWERASDTLHLDSALTELDALLSVLEETASSLVPRNLARRWLVDAWVDALAVDRGVPCVDPLSGLHTPGYLLGRIRELDRLTWESASLVLLSMRWRRPPGPWQRIGTVVSAAAILQKIIRPQATLAQDGPHAVVALVPDDLRARVECACLARECRSSPLHEANARADLISLPADRSPVSDILRRLRLSVGEDESLSSPESRNLPGVVD